MNKINKLLDLDFARDYLRKNILPKYPNFKEIRSIQIIAHKKMIWETTYHVVFEFETIFIDKDGQENLMPIFCTAHSNEPRKNVYNSLKFLWEKGFSLGDLSIPHPLFYSSYFRATFYRGVEGKNLYYYIKKNDREELEEMVPKAAALFSKLHDIQNDGTQNFNKRYGRISTINLGAKRLLERIANEHPSFESFYREAYRFFIREENRFLRLTPSLWLIHGDAHPENIIRMSERKVALIDFTDLSFADFTRDLGSFTQQLDYMIGRKIGDPAFAKKMSKLFLNSYFQVSPSRPRSESTEKRIKLYYNWTAIRTATHFLLKKHPEPPRAEELITMVSKNLNLS